MDMYGKYWWIPFQKMIGIIFPSLQTKGNSLSGILHHCMEDPWQKQVTFSLYHKPLNRHNYFVKTNKK